MKTLCNKFAKIETNCFGHMTEMANISIYGKSPLKSFSPEPNETMSISMFKRSRLTFDLLANVAYIGVPSIN